MESYVTAELPALIAANFPADMDRQAITGHSMGGHGALTLALRHPGRYRSVSAFAPIVAPSLVPWGEKALGRYLGDDRAAWRGARCGRPDRGWRAAQRPARRPGRGQYVSRGAACGPNCSRRPAPLRGIPLTLRRRPGYDHSYYFISTFMEEHLHWHAQQLCPAVQQKYK